MEVQGNPGLRRHAGVRDFLRLRSFGAQARRL
jgi:hypothetical protein